MKHATTTASTTAGAAAGAGSNGGAATPTPTPTTTAPTDGAASAAVTPAAAGAGTGEEPPQNGAAFFAVFDGHSGATIAQFCGAMLPHFVVSTPAFRDGRLKDALRDAYVDIDKHLSQHPTYRNDRSGCTAVSLLVTRDELLCANAGDSRSVLCRGGRAVPLSFDHKPTLPLEKKRIERAKSVVHNRRVNGVLALSRALGDFSFKRRPFIPWEEQAVTCVPDVVALQIERGADEFVVVACDGIWDVMSNEAVVGFVRSRLLRGVQPHAVCEMLMDTCLSTSPFGLGCDNMSVIIVLLQGTHELSAVVDKDQAAASTATSTGGGGAHHSHGAGAGAAAAAAVSSSTHPATHAASTKHQ